MGSAFSIPHLSSRAAIGFGSSFGTSPPRTWRSGSHMCTARCSTWQRSGLLADLGATHVFPTLDTAVRWAIELGNRP
jgi:hypothetical protein